MGIDRALIYATLGVFASLLIISGGSPYWWLGCGLLYLIAGDAFLTLRDSTIYRRLCERLTTEREFASWTATPAKLAAELGGLAVVVWGASWLYGPERIFERIVQGDHAAHFAKALLIKEALADTGTFFTWTHDWFAGFPLGYLYPPGGTLWILAVDTITLGLAEFSQVYAFAVFGFFAFYGLAVYWVGRQAGGPLVGIVAALMAMADPGEGRAGGWNWAMQTGVWPNSLSMAFALVSLASARKLLCSDSLRWVGFFALTLGASLLTHPMQIFFYGALALALAASIAFLDSAERSKALIRAGMAYLPGVGIALLWFIPFSSLGADFGFKAGAWWSPAWDMGASIFEFSLIPGRGAGFTALALVGGFFAWRSKNSLARITVGTALILMATMNSSFVEAFNLPRWIEGLNFVQFIRGTIMVRPLFAVFAAFTVVVALRTISERMPEFDRKRLIISAFLVTLFVPIAAGFLDRLNNVGPLADVTLESEWRGATDRADLAAWIREELPDQLFYRIAYLWGSGSSKPLSFSTMIDKPWFKAEGGTPTVNFKERVISNRGDVFVQTNVRYVVHDEPIESDDYRLLETFGELRIYEFERWQPEPFSIDGNGQVEVEAFERERIVLRASEKASGSLTLRVSAFPRWRAFHDGRPVEIESVSVPGHSTGHFMRIPVSPGTIEFRFERTSGDLIGQVLALIALVFTLLMLAGRPRALEAHLRAGIDRLAGLIDRAARSHTGLVGAAVVVSTGVSLVLLLPRIDGPDRSTVFDFERLDDAQVAEITSEGKRICEPLFDRHNCRPGAWGHVAPRPARIEARSNRQCISATPPAGGSLHVEYDGVPLGDKLVGHVGVPYPNRMPRGEWTDFKIEVDGNEIWRKRVRRAQRTYRFELLTNPSNSADVRFSVSSKSRSVPTCFYAAARENGD